MMNNLDFSEFILNMYNLPPVGISEGGVQWLNNVRRMFVQFLKDIQIEYLALKAQFKKKCSGNQF